MYYDYKLLAQSGDWSVLTTGFPISILPYAGYSVKLEKKY